MYHNTIFWIFLSTLSLRRATPPGLLHSLGGVISIHALLAESDLRVVDGSRSSIISIHALLAESDEVSGDTWQRGSNFYPRSPCGERQARRDSRQQPAGISIHALLAESDVFFSGGAG